jgi:hypothetical protein
MSWLETPSDFDAHALAEFIEAELLFSLDDYLSLTELRLVFSSGRQPTDDELAFAFAEIEARREAFGAHYPYLVDDRGVALVAGSTSHLYAFLLLLSLKGTPMRVRGEWPRSDAIFDAVAREAFKAWLGESTQALVFGWPPRGGRPGDFPGAVKWAGDAVGVTTREDEVPGHLRDGGVDVIAWRPFPDRRTGFEIYLIQNTVQLSFRAKPHDVRPLRWSTWWRIGALPSVGFAIPFAMPDGDPWWGDVSDGTAVVMDRGRLMYALRDVDPRSWPEWPSLIDFVDAEIADVHAAGQFLPEPTVAVVPTRAKK